MKIKLSKEEMLDILMEDHDTGEIVEDNILETSRWSVLHEIVFSLNGTHYSTGYSVGATEMQDEGPWEYDKEVECTEVHQVEKVVKVWKAVR